tara:strand:- start:941 stop:1210 length:270 start_codon:yes stop_codon:yes gene_type:complete
MSRIVTRIGDSNKRFHKHCFIDTQYDGQAGEFVSLCRVISIAPDGQQEWHDKPVLAYAPERGESIELCLATVQQRNPDQKIGSSSINGL